MIAENVHQGVASFGGTTKTERALGARPVTRPEMEQLSIDENGEPQFVEDTVNMANWSPLR